VKRRREENDTKDFITESGHTCRVPSKLGPRQRGRGGEKGSVGTAITVLAQAGFGSISRIGECLAGEPERRKEMNREGQ